MREEQWHISNKPLSLESRKPVSPIANRDKMLAQPEAQKSGRGKLPRRFVGGALAGSLNAGSLPGNNRSCDDEENVECLRARREEIRKERDALLSEEVNIEIKLRKTERYGGTRH